MCGWLTVKQSLLFSAIIIPTIKPSEKSYSGQVLELDMIHITLEPIAMMMPEGSIMNRKLSIAIELSTTRIDRDKRTRLIEGYKFQQINAQL